MVEATVGGDAKATTVERRQKKGRGKKNHDDKNRHDDRDRRNDRERRKKAEAHHVDSRYTSSDDELTDVDDAPKLTASSGAADDNFAMWDNFAVFESVVLH